MSKDKPKDEHILDTIAFEREQLGYKEDAWLRKQGWQQSETPGALWLWQKEIKSITYCVEKSTALYLERSMRWFM